MGPAGHDPGREDTDALLVAAGRGDRAAFAAFYDRTAPSVFGMLHRVLGHRARAELITEDVYLQLWRRAPGFDPSRGSAGATALRAARRALIDTVHNRITAGPASHRDTGGEHAALTGEEDTDRDGHLGGPAPR